MAYQSEAALEQQFIDQLNKQGYTSVSIPDYDALVENFKTQFETFNSAKLDRPLDRQRMGACNEYHARKICFPERKDPSRQVRVGA